MTRRVKQKVGFIWFSAGGPCDGSWPSYRQAWMGSTSFFCESLKVFLGAYPAPVGSTLDLSVQLHHTNGHVIDIVSADRYQNSSGIADVCSVRTFVTPWEFAPGDGLVVYPYGSGPRAADGSYLQWGIWIQAEGCIMATSDEPVALPPEHCCDASVIRQPAPPLATTA